MIFVIHFAAGILIALKIKSLLFVILLAFLSHYFLDFLPHPEYSVLNIRNKKWKKTKLEFLKVFIDLGLGLILIIFSHYLARADYFLLFIAVFFAILPDILNVSKLLLFNNRFLKYHFNFHQIFHFPDNKKISFWKSIFIQFLVILVGFYILLI